MVVIVARTLNIEIDNATTAAAVCDETAIRDWIELTIDTAEVGISGALELALRMVNPDEMRHLNKQFRQRDSATNVLAFPAGVIDGLPADQPRPLGDLVICTEVVVAEARAQGKTVTDHFAHMLVHGTLHLLGHDHETAPEAAIMEALEIRILNTCGVADPYAHGSS